MLKYGSSYFQIKLIALSGNIIMILGNVRGERHLVNGIDLHFLMLKNSFKLDTHLINISKYSCKHKESIQFFELFAI